MKICNPTRQQTGRLPALWKEIFGDYGGFWEVFLETAFSPQRCLCMTDGEEIAASLCWLDTEYDGQKIAYVYAVLTHPKYRGRGLCRKLMDHAHTYLKKLGYTAALLVPAEEGLRQMYEKMGYEGCSSVSEFSILTGEKKEPLRCIGPEEYAALRRELLPQGGVIQEGENLRLLSQDAQFYLGEDFLMAAYTAERTLHALELLGDRRKAPGIVAALDCTRGEFRCPGEEKAFAMVYPLNENFRTPSYFGFAFD